jgi:hypothetical protein
VGTERFPLPKLLTRQRLLKNRLSDAFRCCKRGAITPATIAESASAIQKRLATSGTFALLRPRLCVTAQAHPSPGNEIKATAKKEPNAADVHRDQEHEFERRVGKGDGG